MAFEKLAAQFPQKVHFIGLGGIGMSALALLLAKNGVQVQGSDVKENYLTKNLRDLGIAYFVGHNEKNIDDQISLIVKTSIIKDDNPEIIAALAKGLRILTRAQLLAQIMSYKKPITIAGTHGKTSTTALVGLILQEAGFDPTIVNGGVINEFGSNFKMGDGDFIVAESDESDGSFVALPSFIGAITNIEPEHLDFYGGDFNKVKECFEKYVAQIPQDGCCAMCIDSEEVEKIYQKFHADKKNLLSYSLKKDADLMAKNVAFEVSGSKFDAVFKDGRVIKGIDLAAYGNHNVSNALAAIAIADFLGVGAEKIKEALKNYKGVKRRFTKVGEVNGVVVIDDYAHHPTEISATLNAARQFVGDKKIILVLQPHKNSRVRDLFNEFAACVQSADIVILDDIYSVSHKKIEGISQDSLLENIKKHGHKNAVKLENKNDLAEIVAKFAKAGDLVLCAGAGTITYMAGDLPEQLAKVWNV